MKQNSKSVWVALAALLGVLGCDSSVDIRGPLLPPAPGPSGPSITESRSIADVSGVTLDAVGLVEIDLAGMESLTITAPASVMPLLTSDVVAGRLTLGRTTGSYSGHVSDIRYDLTLRRLEELRLRGVGEMRARAIAADRFVAEVSGVGDVQATGHADLVEVTVSGVGSYYGAGLHSRITRVDIRSGNAQVWATERIEGFVGAGCMLEYMGSPALQIEGGGHVRRLPTTP